MKYKIAILLTTFLRDDLLYKSVFSILKYWNDDCILLIAEQGKQTEEKTNFYDSLDDTKVRIYQLPFDCGLSYARNFLVQKAIEQNYQYCLLTADSLIFTEYLTLMDIISFMETNNNIGIVGFNINGRISWERNIDLIKDKYFNLTIPKELPIEFNNIKYQPCEICRNFFLAKTECLNEVKWDENLKLCEHEDWAWRLKQTRKWKIYYTNYINVNYINDKSNIYNNYRKRIYEEFLYKLRKKYSISGWIKYER